MSEKLNNLQQFMQTAANSSWTACQTNSPYDPNPTGFGQHLEFTLQAKSSELTRLLNEIAEEELDKENYTPEPIDFTKFVRISNREFNHKEVFVGDKWVLVPSDAKINFETRTNNYAGIVQASFAVTISHNRDSTTYTSSETYQQYPDNKPFADNELLLVKGKNLSLNDDELNWMCLGEQMYGVTNKSTNNLSNLNNCYGVSSNQFKRTYSYELSKLARNFGKTTKSGQIFKTAGKFSKSLKLLGPIGNALTIGTISYEALTDTWDAHTVVNGCILVIGITEITIGSGPIVVGIAIYGLLDLVFDVGDGIDDVFGRDSEFWDNRPLYSFPTDENPIFKIDNTYVAPQFVSPLKFKN